MVKTKRHVVLWIAIGLLGGVQACSSDGSGGGAAGGGGASNAALAEACSTYCSKGSGLACVDVPECSADCLDLGTGVPSCTAKLVTALACVAASGTIACDPLGHIDVTGCAQERGDVDTCMEVASEFACTGYCQKYLALPCVPSGMDQATCESQCHQILGLVCPDESLIAYTCAADRGSFSCDSDGKSAVTGCETEVQKLQDCASGSVVTPDGGT